MKLILSTSNIMSSGPTVIRRPIFEKSNTELTTSLRSNFAAHQQQAPQTQNSSTNTSKPSFKTWTLQKEHTLYIPTPTPTPLTEPRPSYDITVKLFYLPNIPASHRGPQTQEAINLVLNELGVESIDLLIVSFPGISFDADDEEDSESENESVSPPSSQSPNNNNNTSIPESEAELPTLLSTWQTLESLHQSQKISRLGVSEFGVSRLSKFLPHTKVRPSVNQINVKDCCVVPKPLILFAKKEGIELLTHNDCTDVLPGGTVREILGGGERGVGVLDDGKGGEGLKGDVEPQFVVKYTAVVKDRGVVESKGYFAVAELREDV